MATNLIFQNGYYESNQVISWSSQLKEAFKVFVNQPMAYKTKYLQSEFSYAFDGYSFMGQEDSQNQYPSDLLHSMVLSSGTEISSFPKEFHAYLNDEFHLIRAQIQQVELEVIRQLNMDGLAELYMQQMGHMISCNYYPQIENPEQASEGRLSMHEDVSLFTVFPYGIDNQFYFVNAQGQKQPIAATNKVVVFPGYLLELFTQGEIKALQHGVAGKNNLNSERFSFAFFSIPKANASFQIGSKTYSSQDYFDAYLQLY